MVTSYDEDIKEDSSSHDNSPGFQENLALAKEQSAKEQAAFMFQNFDMMVKDKYQTGRKMYDRMTPQERNNKLKEMIAKNNVIVFPDGYECADGIL